MLGRPPPLIINKPPPFNGALVTNLTERVPSTLSTGRRHHSAVVTPLPSIASDQGSSVSRRLARSGMMLANGEALNRPSFTKEELKEFQQIFDMLDEDKSGKINCIELANYTRSMGLQFEPQELETMIAQNDPDGDGQLDFDEFCLTLKKMSGIQHQTTWEDVIKQCFLVFDRNETGSITEDDFRLVLMEIGGITDEETLDTVFAEVDVDGNGLIEYEEFSAMVRSYMKEEDILSIHC